MRSSVLASLLLLTLSGCVSFPDSVQVPEGTNVVTYEQVASNPEITKNKIAQWGGVVASVENQKDSTLVEMVYYPLRSYGRPSVGKESIGRFRVYVNGFLDPMVYQQGRSMTFSGAVVGTEEGLVGEHNYIFPTLQASGYHLWEDIDRIDVTTISVWPYYHHGYWGIGHPRYRFGWYAWPYRTFTVTRRHDHYRYPKHHHKSTTSSSKQTTTNNSSKTTHNEERSNRAQKTERRQERAGVSLPH